MGNPFGRNVILPLTNQSGASVAAGDFVYLDTAHNDAFITGTTANYTGGIGIAQQAIGAGSVGLVLVSGYAALVNVNASVTRGHFGAGYTVAKQATDAGASRASGTFCQFLTGGTTPDAMIWQPDLGGGSGMTNPMTTTGDMIYSSSGSTPARLAAVAAGQVITSAGTSTAPAWGAPSALFGWVRALSNADTTCANATWTPIALATETYDTGGYHDNVTNNSRITMTATGYLIIMAAFGFRNSASTAIRYGALYKNGSSVATTQASSLGSGSDGVPSFTIADAFPCVATDYFQLYAYQATGGNLNVYEATLTGIFIPS